MSRVGRFTGCVILPLILNACGDSGSEVAGLGPVETRADWPAFGNQAGGGQYSPLDKINTSNVNRLKVAWIYKLHEESLLKSESKVSGDVSSATFEATPIHANGTLYFCTPLNRVIALDPSTGKEKWVFDPHLARISGAPIEKGPRAFHICRGVSYWQTANPVAGEKCQKRIFKADSDGRVFALDADTGALCGDFGAKKGHPGYVTQRDFENFGTDDKAVGSTSPPAVIGDVVISAANSMTRTIDANDGFVRAFDVRTGDLKWEFNPVPPGREHETGQANAWSIITVDPERRLVFVPTTSPSDDYYGGRRKFDFPLANSTVALSAETGKVVWHFQTVHHDLNDYDIGPSPLAVTIRKDGKTRPVVIQPTKMGMVFVLDRTTGAPVFPIEERPIPRSDVDGEQSSPTQPFSVLPEHFTRTKLTPKDIFGLTPIDRAWCQSQFRKYRYEGLFTPPSERGSIQFPWPDGGGNWGGATYDPKRNLLVLRGENIATIPQIVKTDGTKDPSKLPKGVISYYINGVPFRAKYDVFLSPLGIPCTAPPWGTLTAIDMSSGRIKWQIPYGQSKKFGIRAPEFLHWGSPLTGGPIATAGGLVFYGGDMAGTLRAVETSTGKQLWKTTLPTGKSSSVPMTYLARGEQYLAISAGGVDKLDMAQRKPPDNSEVIVAYKIQSER